MEIGVTTGRWIQPDPRRRIEAVLAWGRLGLGQARRLLGERARAGLGGDLLRGRVGRHRRRAGRVDERRRRHAASAGDPADDDPGARRVDRDGPRHGRRRVACGSCARWASSPVPVLLHGEEGGAWPVLEYALRTKQDTRIGFEDVLQRPDGWLATGNDDLVRAAQAIRVLTVVRNSFWRLQRNPSVRRGSRRGNPSDRSIPSGVWRSGGRSVAGRRRGRATSRTCSPHRCCPTTCWARSTPSGRPPSRPAGSWRCAGRPPTPPRCCCAPARGGRVTGPASTSASAPGSKACGTGARTR